MAINRISGNILQNNLQRGANLAIETNLLYIDVDNDRVGINTSSTTHTLTVDGNTNITGNLSAGNISTTGNVDAAVINATDIYVGNIDIGNLLGNFYGNAIDMGEPGQGNLVSNAVTLTSSTTVTDGIALLNVVLGKLVPPAPPNFPGGNTLSITTSTTTVKMCDGFTQNDNTPGANKAVAAGTTVAVIRGSSYGTNTISNTGPGDSGTLTLYLNGVDAGNVTFNTDADPTANGTYSNLIVSNNYDYNTANANITAGFWYVFSARGSGTVTDGWNEVLIGHSGTGNTNTPYWYYDGASVSAPQFTNTSIAPTANNYTYTSTIPHYNSSSQFTLGFDVNRLSGNTYPNSTNLTSTTAAGGSFAAPVAVSYAAANVTVPLTQNLYVSSGAASATTTANITTGFGSSSTGPSVTVTNSYNSASNTFSPGVTVLRKTGSATAIDEGNIVVTTVGTGSGNAVRIINPGSGNTPAYTANASAFNSQSSTLETYDATVVGSGSAGVLKHDQTNYSTGYLPVGPDLSSGRSGTQYFTFKFIRTDVSKFDITYAGNVAGMWVALPGSAIDSSSGANGWIDMTVAYAGAGYPGVNSPGNGSDGCALGGVVVPNVSTASTSKTCTFGTVSSSSTATNEIYIRIALTSGQTVTALSMKAASN